MTAPTKVLVAPPSGIIYHDPGILRPQSRLTHTGSVGNVDIRWQWDTDSGFGGNTNEVVSLEYEDATAGSYDLDFDGVVSNTIQWDDDAAAIKTALEAAANIHTVNVTGTGTVADPFLVEFQDPINGGRNVPDMTVNSDSLTGDTVALAIDTQGVAGPPIDILNLNDSGTGDEQAPDSDLGLAGPWFWRVAVIDRDDGLGSWSGSQTLNYVDPIIYNRYLSLLANVGVAFHDTDEPAGGWGPGGTEGADGDIRDDFNRYLYLLANVGVGFETTDRPAAGWGPGGTVGPDGNIRDDFDRFLYLLANVTTTQPCPFLFSLSKTTAETGDTVTISGQGLVSADDPTDAWDHEVRLYETQDLGGSFVVMASITWDSGELVDTITVTVPAGSSSGFVAVVHTTGATCTGSNFIGLTVIALAADSEAGWWVEAWNIRNTAPILTPIFNVKSAEFEYIAGDIGSGSIVVPKDHVDIPAMLDRSVAPPVQTLLKIYEHGRFSYAFIPDDIDEQYDEDGADEARLYGSGQEIILTWGRCLWKDYPTQPARNRTWLYGSTDNLVEWGDMEPVNRLFNGDIEDASSEPWVPVGTAALFATTAEAHAGTYSLKVTPNALDDGVEIDFSQQDGDGVFTDIFTKVNLIGGTYEIEVLKVDPDDEDDPPGDIVLATFTWIPGSSAWLKTTLDYVSDAAIGVRLRITQTAGTLTQFFVDDAAAYTAIDGTLLAFKATQRLSRTEVAAGEHSVRVDAEAGGDVTFNGVEGFFTESPNQLHRFSVAVNGVTGKKVRFDVRLSGVLQTVTQVLTGGGAFDVMTIEGIAGPETTTGRFTLRSLESASLVFFMDELSITPGEAAATPGKIIGDVHAGMVARGTLDFVTLGFTDTTDSKGQGWIETLAFQVQPEWTMWDLVEKFEGLGYGVEFTPVNWRAGGDTGWVLHLYNPGTIGEDYSAQAEGPTVLPGDTLQGGSSSQAVPVSTIVFGEGEDGLWTVAQAAAATIAALERREDFVTNISLRDNTALFRAVSHRLDVTETRGERFVAEFTDAGSPLPFFTMLPHDRMLAHLPQTEDFDRDIVPFATYRVAAITALLTAGGLTQQWAVDFGSYELHAERITNLVMARMLGRGTTENYQPGTGSVSHGGTSGSGATLSAAASGGGAAEPHSHVWPDVQPIAVGQDLSGTMPNPQVVGLRGRPLSAAAPAQDEGYFFDIPSGEFRLAVGGGGGGGGSPLTTGQYTGDGSDPQTITLPSRADIVFIYGTPSGGRDNQAWSFRGSGGLKYSETQHTDAIDFQDQLQLAADGLSFDVNGVAQDGLNESGEVYDFVIISGAGGVASAGRIVSTSDQAIGASAFTEVAFGASEVDVGEIVDLANNGFTAIESGVYVVAAVIVYEGGVGTELRVQYAIDGVRLDPMSYRTFDPVDLDAASAGAFPINLLAGETVTVEVLFQAAGNLRGDGASTACSFSIWKVGGTGAVPGDWVTPTLLNSWVDFGGAIATAQYRKDSLGVVHLKGTIKDGTTTAATVLFTLPTGHRPTLQRVFGAQTSPSGTSARIDVEADGDVVIQAGNNTFLSLDGISFLADGS